MGRNSSQQGKSTIKSGQRYLQSFLTIDQMAVLLTALIFSTLASTLYGLSPLLSEVRHRNSRGTFSLDLKHSLSGQSSHPSGTQFWRLHAAPDGESSIQETIVNGLQDTSFETLEDTVKEGADIDTITVGEEDAGIDGAAESKDSLKNMLKFALPALGIYLSNPMLSNIDNGTCLSKKRKMLPSRPSRIL